MVSYNDYPEDVRKIANDAIDEHRKRVIQGIEHEIKETIARQEPISDCESVKDNAVYPFKFGSAEEIKSLLCHIVDDMMENGYKLEELGTRPLTRPPRIEFGESYSQHIGQDVVLKFRKP